MEELIQHLEQSQLDYADLVNELQVLISIYGDTALSLHPSTSSPSPSSSSQRIISSTTPLRLVLATTLTDSDLRIHIILSIPHDYPAISPPLLQLQDIYLHSYPVDDTLFAEICRVYMHQAGSGKGIDFQPGEVCLFDGIEWIRTRCTEYAQDRRRKEEEGQAAMKARQREEDRGERIESVQAVTTQPASNRVEEKPFQRRACPVIISAEPIVDRKSSFIGHCAKVTSLDEVEQVIATLLLDKKIARASHNITAYRFTLNGTLYHDNDDDGETAAGSRLGSLLSLLDVTGVVVIVSRFFGGIQLGATRFKHINQAARDALLAGGFLEESVKRGKR